MCGILISAKIRSATFKELLKISLKVLFNRSILYSYAVNKSEYHFGLNTNLWNLTVIYLRLALTELNIWM